VASPTTSQGWLPNKRQPVVILDTYEFASPKVSSSASNGLLLMTLVHFISNMYLSQLTNVHLFMTG
jgi:hypothetical protein